MKKLTLLAAIGVATCLSSFGQGFLVFNNSASTSVKDNFTGSAPTNSPATVTVGILWHAGSGFTLPGLGSTSTTAASVPDWSLVLGGSASGWSFATNATSNPLVALTANTRIPVPTTGTYSGGTLGILGTNPGDTISMYVIGWQLSAGSNPFLAAQAGAGLGWSNPINELLGSSASPGVSMAAGGVTTFTVNPVPEPATFALVGLGSAAMLILRKRKA